MSALTDLQAAAIAYAVSQGYTLTSPPAPPPVPVPPPVTPPSGTLPAFGVQPFTSASRWNTPIAAGAAVHPDSAHMIDDHVTVVRGGTSYYVGWGPTGVPGSQAGWCGMRDLVDRWWVKLADTSSYTMKTVTNTFNGKVFQVPIPNGFSWSSHWSGDEDRTMIYADDGRSWTLGFGITAVSGGYTAGSAGLLAAPYGWTGLGDGASGTNSGVSMSAARIPFDAGLLTPGDIIGCPVGGHYNHALNVNISSSSIGPPGSPHPLFVAPAYQGDGKTPGVSAIPMGATFQLKPSVNVETLPFPEWLKQQARTAQIRGLIVTDTGLEEGGGDGMLCMSRDRAHQAQGGAFVYPWEKDGSGWAYGNGFPGAYMTSQYWQVLAW